MFLQEIPIELHTNVKINVSKSLMPSFIKIHSLVSSLELFEVDQFWGYFPSLCQLNRPIGKLGTQELVFH